jgi:CcmD family protein
MPTYLVAAYAVFWALTFVLVFSIWKRQRQLEREISALAAQLEGTGQDEENAE